MIELCLAKKEVIILVRGGSSMIVEKVKRSIHDALCVVRNMIKDPKIVYGGGSNLIVLLWINANNFPKNFKKKIIIIKKLKIEIFDI